MRVLVCGGRDYDYHVRVYHALDDIQDMYGPFKCIITGDCPTGADHWAESWAWMQKLKHLKFAADWTGYGRAAGPIRNQIMFDEGRPDIGVAFPGGKGTASMIKIMKVGGMKSIKKPPFDGRLFGFT